MNNERPIVGGAYWDAEQARKKDKKDAKRIAKLHDGKTILMPNKITLFDSFVGVGLGFIITFIIFIILAGVLNNFLFGYLMIVIGWTIVFAVLMTNSIKENKGFLTAYYIGSTGILIGIIIYELVKSEMLKSPIKSKK